jgi:hypothetical protein
MRDATADKSGVVRRASSRLGAARAPLGGFDPAGKRALWIPEAHEVVGFGQRAAAEVFARIEPCLIRV